jgi:hypothetical protein
MFDLGTFSTDYVVTTIFLAKKIVVAAPKVAAVFPKEYRGSVGFSLLKNAPKPK